MEVSYLEREISRAKLEIKMLKSGIGIDCTNSTVDKMREDIKNQELALRKMRRDYETVKKYIELKYGGLDVIDAETKELEDTNE